MRFLRHCSVMHLSHAPLKIWWLVKSIQIITVDNGLQFKLIPKDMCSNSLILCNDWWLDWTTNKQPHRKNTLPKGSPKAHCPAPAIDLVKILVKRCSKSFFILIWPRAKEKTWDASHTKMSCLPLVPKRLRPQLCIPPVIQCGVVNPPRFRVKAELQVVSFFLEIFKWTCVFLGGEGLKDDAYIQPLVFRWSSHELSAKLRFHPPKRLQFTSRF